MLFQEGQWLLFLRGRPLQQSADAFEARGSVTGRCFAGLLQSDRCVFAGESFQADQHAHALDTTGGDHQFAPSFCVRTDRRDLPEQCVCAAFDRRDFFRRNMRGIRAKTARLAPAVNRDLLPLTVEDTHHPRVPSHPDAAADVLRWRRVERLVDFQVTVAADRAA